MNNIEPTPLQAGKPARPSTCALVSHFTARPASTSALTCLPLCFPDHKVLIFTTTPPTLNALSCLLCLLGACPPNTLKPLQESIPSQSHPDVVVAFLCLL